LGRGAGIPKLTSPFPDSHLGFDFLTVHSFGLLVLTTAY
jgi:hypothetical protein